ncbi:transcription initiation factor IID TAF10 subunit [Polychytrium aggregatum]|uniref:transcription initiation factor IID TAF10 subunit n=1 Tax=Polychytrium aggregatum TaxID=110093 RepID=UPI0022FEE247|nr:transcription initiation factor IID TAF10 subunit [Polychytrium aggregatum]KAI9205231.1 transcription initiation factor IID TAF10 subunit [Polychytrium aggregatum]
MDASPQDAGPQPTAEQAESQTAKGKKYTPRDEKADKSLAEILVAMDDFAPIIPDAVTDYYLEKAGVQCSDQRIKRLLGLAAQKFVADIATDALQYSKIRQGSQGKERKMGLKDRKTVLTVEDLSAALGDYGINVKKPDFYQ